MTNLESKTEDNSPRTVSDIIASIEPIETIKFPSIQSYLSVGDYFLQMNEALKIIKKYKNSEVSYDIALMNEDLLQLSAIHVSIAELIGYLQGWARFAEDQRKVSKSAYAVKIKNRRDSVETTSGFAVKITEAEIDNFSRVLAREHYIQAADSETISRMMYHAWYSVGDFTKLLNSQIARLHQELYSHK